MKPSIQLGSQENATVQYTPLKTYSEVLEVVLELHRAYYQTTQLSRFGRVTHDFRYILTISQSVIYKYDLQLRSNSILSVKYRHSLPVQLTSLLLLRSSLAWQLKLYYGFWG